MNGKNGENQRLEDLLRKAQLPGPSTELKRQIITGAKKAWNQTTAELPWLVPFRRLVASAAAAIIIIWLANYSSECLLAQWQPTKFPAATEQAPGLESLTEIPCDSFVRRLVSVNRRPSTIDASALNNHVETLRRILDETQQSRITGPSEPSGGTSHLNSNPANTSSYS
jgi:hypothetical protein